MFGFLINYWTVVSSFGERVVFLIESCVKVTKFTLNLVSGLMGFCIIVGKKQYLYVHGLRVNLKRNV